MSELYTLPDGWEWKTFDEVSTFIRGITFKPNEKFEEPNENTIFCFRTTNIQTELDDTDLLNIDLSLIKSDEKLVINGDILISSANSLELLGKCCLVRNINYKATLGGFIVCGRANQKVLDTKYYYYYFSSESNQNRMRNLANKTTGIANLPMKKVEKEYIPLPPLEEQKRIVDKLDNLFAKIDKAIDLHQKNIDEANVFMASVLNDVFVELEEKYEKKQLSEIVIFGGKNISTLEYPDLIYFSLEDIEAQTGRILNYKTVNEAGVKGTAVRFDENVVLYSKLRPYLNKVIVPNLEGCSTTELVVLKPKDKLDKYFLASYLRSSNIVNFLNNDSMGAKMPRTNMKTFRNLEISFPPYETQQKVVSYLDEISQKMEKIKQIQKEKMQSLKALKASILDQAFKGEL